MLLKPTRRQFLLGVSAASALVVLPRLPGLAWSDAVDLRVRCVSMIKGSAHAAESLPIEIISMELEPSVERAAIDVSSLNQRSDALEIGLLRGRHLRIRGLIGLDVWTAYRERRLVTISIPCGAAWYYTASFAISDIKPIGT
jgi:hypothetical protein